MPQGPSRFWVVSALWLSGAASIALVILVLIGGASSPADVLLLGTAAVMLVAALLLWWRGRRGSDPPQATTLAAPAPAGQQPAAVVDRRHALGRGFAVAAGAFGLAGVATARPGPVQAVTVPNQLDIWDFAEAVTDRPNAHDPATWDWTPAVQAAVDQAGRRASKTKGLKTPGAIRSNGLPSLLLPHGTYRTAGTVSLHFLHGFTLRGEGRQATVLEHRGAGPLFDIRRSDAITVEGLTVLGRDPNAQGDVQGLVENSCAFHLEEHASDAEKGGGNTFGLRFSDVEVQQMHRAFHFVGDQMTDGVLIENVWLRDNFYDFDYENGQAVNHQVIGGQVAYAVDRAEAAYQARLDAWTTKPSLLDGAVIRVRGGGQVSFFGGVIICNKSTLLFDKLPQDNSLGVTANVLPYLFVGTRWEFRHADPGGDGHGQQRITVLRYLDPFLTPRELQPAVRFVGCDWVVIRDPVTLFHLANAVTVTVDSSRVWPPARAALVSLVDATTAALPGVYRSTNTTVLSHERRTAPAGAPPAVNHIIDMRDAPAPGSAPVSAHLHQRTLVAGVPLGVQRILQWGQDGSLLPTTSTHAVLTLLVPTGANAIIKQVGAVALGDSGGRTAITFSDVTGKQVYGSLELDSAGQGRFDGMVLSPHPRTYALVEQLASVNGVVKVELTREQAGPLSGYVYVDYV